MKIYKFVLIESDGVALIIESTSIHLAFMTLGAIVVDINEWKLI
jgi:hypothetical protein